MPDMAVGRLDGSAPDEADSVVLCGLSATPTTLRVVLVV